MAFPQLPIVIIEVTGRLRPLVFFGSFLPHQGSETVFGQKMRGKESWYPGASSASSQVLGLEYEPIKFAGVLEDQRTGIPGGAVAMMWLIEQIGKAGNIVLFNYGTITRRCRWLRHQVKTTELQRIHYEIELQPIGDGVRDRTRVKKGIRTKPNQDRALVFVAELDDEFIRTGAQAEGARTELSKVDGFIRDGGALLDNSVTPGSIVDQTKTTGALTSFNSAKAALSDTFDKASSLTWESIAGPTFKSLSTVGDALAKVQTGLSRTAIELFSLRDAAAGLVGEPDQGLVYVSAAGETLQGIAQRFYGSVSQWTQIMADNGKTSPIVIAGEQLLLKDVPTLDVLTVP